MKIGILTYHRSHNYGALLQAIALRDFLRAIGQDACIIDYWPTYHKNMYRMLDMEYLKRASAIKKIKYLLKKGPLIFKRRKRNLNFKSFIKAHIEPYLEPYSKNNCFDIVIYGSDQIWRKQSGLGNKFNPVYFGDNILTSNKHVAYSASMGNINLTADDKKFLCDKLSIFSDIAVRETDLREKLLEIGIKDVALTIDPTFLLSKSDWIEKFNLDKTSRIIEKPYILYFNLIENCFDLSQIKSFAQEKGYELIILESDARHFFNKSKVLETVGPATFLNLVMNAELVMTSSFHGLAFSIIFEKDFFASFTSNSQRAKTLLDTIGIPDRLLPPRSSIPMDMTPIDYNNVNIRIQKMIEKSKDYLLNNIKQTSMV